MDMVSHALLGAAAGCSVFSGKLGRTALLLSGAGALVPDVDFLFTTFADPAMPGEWHRHFTHSLAFVPLGGLIALTPLLLFRSIRTQWKLALAATTLGCATHAALDCATSYGTLWLWPFSFTRVSWDIISVIDPVFTVMLLLGVIIASFTATRKPAAIALGLGLTYLGLGFVQNQRGLAVQRELAAARGDVIDRGRVMPTLGNLVVWRSLYEADGVLQADAIRLPFTSDARVRTGEPIARLTPDMLPADSSDRVIDIITRFSDFAQGYIAVVSTDPVVIGDLRYAPAADVARPLWGLTIKPGNPHPDHTTIEWTTFFEARAELLPVLWENIWSEEGFTPMPAPSPSSPPASPAPATAPD